MFLVPGDEPSSVVCAVTAAAAAIIAVMSLKTISLFPPPAGTAATAMFLLPYLGLAAAAGAVGVAMKLKEYIQNFFFKDYVQSRSGK